MRLILAAPDPSLASVLCDAEAREQICQLALNDARMLYMPQHVGKDDRKALAPESVMFRSRAFLDVHYCCRERRRYARVEVAHTSQRVARSQEHLRIVDDLRDVVPRDSVHAELRDAK